MMRAIWNGVVLAEAEHTVRVEGNHYFPKDSLNLQYFARSSHTSVCPWKGSARYFDVVVDGDVNRAAAWYYPKPSEAAREITDHVAFWRGVRIETHDDEPAHGRRRLWPRSRT
jgi:uncharacterized protein (DUF427 family)